MSTNPCVAAFVIGIVTVWSRVAIADTACPTTTSSISENLYIYGFDVAKLSQVHDDAPLGYPRKPTVYMGNFNFYGNSTVGACVTYTTKEGNGLFTLHQEAYVVTDHNNNLLAWLPKDYNHMCSMYNAASNEFYVVTGTESHCGISYSPLDYHARELLVYAGGGQDHFHGGLGVDDIYGGADFDDIDDVGTSTYGEVWGEEGPDFCFGSRASGTWVWGGSGDDELDDGGGYTDNLNGGDGNECCVRDSNDQVWDLACGSGPTSTHDTADSAAADQDCETISSTCNAYADGISCL